MAETVSLEKFAEEITNTQTTQLVWDKLAKFVVPLGIDALSYYHIAPPGSQDFSEKYFTSVGFDQVEADNHRRNHSHFNSPFTSRANPVTAPLFWTEVLDTLPLTEQQTDELKLFYHCDDGANGLVLPVFGPNSRNGCLVFRFSNPNHNFDRESVHTVSFAAYIAHLQFCRIRAENISENIHLTAREKEVLTWVARGKSNSVIADIVGISQHTVNGYLRRIYLKTRTTDRTSAAMRAIGDGLIDY